MSTGPDPDTPTSVDAATDVRRKTVRAVVGLGARGIAIRSLGLAGTVVLARFLVPSDFGLVAVAQSLIAVGSMIGAKGIAVALIQREVQPPADELRVVFGFQLAITMGLAAAIAAVGIPLGKPGVVVTLMALSLPIEALRALPNVMAERSLSFSVIVHAEIVETIAFNAAAVALVVAGFDVYGVAAAVILKSVVGTFILVRWGPVGLLSPRFDWRVIKPILRFGLTIQAVPLIVTLRDYALNLGVSIVGGATLLGFYNLAARLLQVLLLLLEALWRVSFPATARLLETGQDPRPLIERALAITSLSAGAMTVALAAPAPALVPLVFGPVWQEAAGVLPWAAFGLFVSGPLSACVSGFLYARGEAQQILWANVLHTFVWIGTSLALINSLGSAAVGVGSAIAGALDLAYMSFVLRRRLPVAIARSVGWPTVVTAAVVAAGWFAADSMDATVTTLVVILLLTLTAYFLLMAALQRGALRESTALLQRSLRPLAKT